MQRICVDMDEVMADTLAEHLRRYNQAFDEAAMTTEDLAGKGLWEIAPQDRQAELPRLYRRRRLFRSVGSDTRCAAGAREAFLAF